MSSNNHRTIKISKEEKKVTVKGLKEIFNSISKRIFSRVHKNEVEYGQTLSKKRRKNCILKNVSALSCPDDDNRFLVQSPYHINFKFSKDDPHFRGSVMNFQKIDIEKACCEKCLTTSRKGDSLSKFSISSDSACDVSSESSCDDLDCEYRKSKVKLRKKKSKSTGDVYNGRTVENFIRIHNENFQNVEEPQITANDVNENVENCLLEWTTEEPGYESLVSKSGNGIDDTDYDILVTRASYRVVEPSYENLKLIENLYETPACKEAQEEDPEKGRDGIQGKKTYDEVIESLKLWHMSTRYPEECGNCACCGERIENEFNHCVEGYESLENDFNNDIEEFCC